MLKFSKKRDSFFQMLIRFNYEFKLENRFKKMFFYLVRVIIFLALTGVLNSCNTLDQYLVDDQTFLDQEVVIVGGGVSGLYSAYLLKKNKIPFKIFEASNQIGGIQYTATHSDFENFVYRQKDQNLISLSKELELERTDLGASCCFNSETALDQNLKFYQPHKYWQFKEGDASFLNELSARVEGVLPRKQVKVNSKLVSVVPVGKYYELIFEVKNLDTQEKNEKVILAKKVILALPFSSLVEIRNLNKLKSYLKLENMSERLKPVNTYRLLIPTKSLLPQYQKLGLPLGLALKKLSLSQNVLIQSLFNQEVLYLDLQYNVGQFEQNLEQIEKSFSALTVKPLKLDGENIFKWGSQFASKDAIHLDSKEGDTRLDKGLFFINDVQSNFLTDKSERSSVENEMIQVRSIIDIIKMDI